jgi:Ca2+-binding RTX toxin-like protein
VTQSRADFQIAERVLDSHRHRFDYFIQGGEVSTTTPASTFATLDAATGTLTIRGTINDDVFGLIVSGPLLIVKLNGAAASFNVIDVNRINLSAYAGDDRISIIPGVIGVNINGGDGNDTIFGGDGADRIDGGAGDDLIKGQGGNDTIFGSDGNDSIYGQAGDDSIQGNNGDDRILGGDGNDYLDGGAGNDRLYGEAGTDTLLGGSGHNTLIQDPLP